jgi:hypothetical protein
MIKVNVKKATVKYLNTRGVSNKNAWRVADVVEES